MLFIVFMAILAGTGDDNSPAGISNSPQGLVGNLSQEGINGKWKLVNFENLAIEVDGEIYDKGEFISQATGEKVIGYCVSPDAADPAVNDIFTMSGKMLYPTKGSAQSFQVFQVLTPTPQPTPTLVPTLVPTPTIIPTPTPITTFKGKVTHLAQEAAAIAIMFVVIVGLCVGYYFFWRWGNKVS